MAAKSKGYTLNEFFAHKSKAVSFLPKFAGKKRVLLSHFEG
jgi:hypothetical protein